MNYCDKYGYPGTMQKGIFNGGDTAAILGTLWYFGEFFHQELPAFYSFDGQQLIPLRHPDNRFWWGDDDRFSRDQLKAVQCGYLVNPDKETCDKLYDAHKRNKFLVAWNRKENGQDDPPDQRRDVTALTTWANWLRIYKPKGMRLVLGLCDLELLFSALHWRYFRKDRVSRNHMLCSLAAYEHSPTLISRLVFHINNWDDLITRWEGHCETVCEYPTAHLFRERVRKLKGNK